MITYDHEGRDLYINPREIATINTAGTSSQYHGIRSVVHMNDGRVIECGEELKSLLKKMDS